MVYAYHFSAQVFYLHIGMALLHIIGG